MILVTGASGRVGSRLVEALVEKKEKVRTFDTRSTNKQRGVGHVCGNILNKDDVKSALEGVDTIYHLAALVNYKKVPKSLLYKVNVIGTKNLIECSKAKKFIYLSTTAVYGNNLKTNPAIESTPYHPSSYYGKTKMMAEKLVLSSGGIVIRSPVIFGPGFNEGFTSVMSQLEKGKMRIIGKGENRIHWIHISDLISALVLAKDKGRRGQVYLVAGKEVKTQRELFSILAKALGANPPSKNVSSSLAHAMAHYKIITAKLSGKEPSILPEHLQRVISDRTYDISKAKKELGFRPKANYEQAAREMAKEYRPLKTKI